MVYVKRVELSNFKSFGGTTSIPLLPGFTVVSGPNGSGKSNILDALLFCLGLASSKGMRAERLPDLVNHNQTHRGTVEASVTVTFDLSDVPDAFSEEEETQNGQGGNLDDPPQPPLKNGDDDPPLPPLKKGGRNDNSEWSVTRKLRVTQQGTYTSNYYINGASCNLTELHEQMNRLRIYPEGYNVVLQGDVTGIISMNPRERREIIDELAGVATFDRKIVQAKETLDSVKEREDSCRIVEAELVAQRDRLSQDRIKAEKYQKLRAELQQKEQWEAVLKWRSLQQQEQRLKEQIAAGDRTSVELTTQLTALNAQIQQTTAELDQLNARVKALGEEELLALQSVLATQEAERRASQRQQRELETAAQNTTASIEQEERSFQQHQQTLQHLSEENDVETRSLASLRAARDEAQQVLEQRREAASAIAAASEAWVQQQTLFNRQIETLLQTVEPQRTEQAQLRERYANLGRQIEEQSQLLQTIEPDNTTKQSRLADFEIQLNDYAQEIASLEQSLAAAEHELQIQQETQKRLLQEQRDKQRQLDKLEAQAQAEQEAQGTFATKVILQSGLPGVCGLVAQLGRVEPRYQLALETAAGGRLGNLVVEDDGVAAAGIELLKQKRAGRITFLPLNKIQPPRFSQTVALSYANGFIDYAVNLIDCEARYRDIFAYVFGSTVIFETLNDARRHLGQHRIVTLDGELLESSGAMTGGSSNQRSGLHFGTADAAESAEAAALRNRLQEIERILERCGEIINSLTAKAKHLSQELTEAKAKRREQELQCEQLHKEIKNLIAQAEQARSLLSKNTQEFNTAESRLASLDAELPAQEAQLQQLRQALAELEQSQTSSEWQQIQATIKTGEQQLQEREKALRVAEQRLKDLENQQQRSQEKIQESQQRLQEYRTQQIEQQNQLTALSTQHLALSTQIAQTQAALKQQEERLGEIKQQRDRSEQELRSRHLSQQQLEWQLQKLQETQQQHREALATVQPQLEAQQAELPDPVPEVPMLVNPGSTETEAIAFDSLTAQLEQLQKEMRAIAKRLQAMEPVNMLALEEYERTTTRLEELTQKVATLEAERTELLLRIENFTTLRSRAFQEAFDAVNQNFQSIFAELSDGDGYLQLDDSEDPFAGGLNLVAHPKGKPVQRLASMSGGEKSLTALSFIFALQHYRPSPFYAFDEVDMFLDGANVERLARMIKQQAMQAQFIVVSLRRPMIESSERTIGVTQARGAYTQVLGLKLQSQKESV
ncbi:chromosome segregation protein SMC [Coleofasciculus sp. H7-2]|uniref:chromosome segregation protein SMC n=1 Tax=Coleofasciculus sp. H7-2 TaxID=3351545 RepID=UPI00366ABDCE